MTHDSRPAWGRPITARLRTRIRSMTMKIKTNIRAGQSANSGGVNGGGASGSGHNSKENQVEVVYTPPVLLSRCVGY